MSNIQFYENIDTGNGNSAQWNSTYTTVNTNSASWSSGGGNVVPCASDFVLKKSFNIAHNNPYKWAHGKQEDFGGTNKFQVMVDEGNSVYFLDFELIGGQAKGKGISFCNGTSSIRIDYENLIFRDDGYGGYWANYCDFINQIFNNLSLYTRLSAADDGTWRANFCKLDDFVFYFKETPSQIFTDDYGIENPRYFVLHGTEGFFLGDKIDLQPVYIYWRPWINA